MKNNSIQKKDIFQVQKLENYVLGLSNKRRAILNKILRYCFKYKTVWFSQEFLGKESECTRQWVNRVVQELEQVGYIYKIYRHRKTCKYVIPDQWKSSNVREALKKHLSALWFLPIAYLAISSYSSILAKKFTPIYYPYTEKELRYNTYAVKVPRSIVEHLAMLKKTEAEIMKQFPIRKDIITVAKKYGFTTAGMIKLMPFCEEALKEVDERYGHKIVGARDPHRFMVYFLREWYKNYPQSVPNWQDERRLMQLFQLPEDSARFIKNYQKLRDTQHKDTKHTPFSAADPSSKSIKWKGEGLTHKPKLNHATTNKIGSNGPARRSFSEDGPRNFRDARLGGNEINPAMPKFEGKVIERTKITERPVSNSPNTQFFLELAKKPPAWTHEN